MSGGRLPLQIAALITGLAPVPDSTLLLLESAEDADSVLPVLIGLREGEAIREGLTGRFFDRPNPYDLFVNLLEIGGLEVREVVIDKIRKNAYHAKIVVAAGEETSQLDSRTSDGVAIALRTHAPIFALAEVYESAKQPKEQFAALLKGAQEGEAGSEESEAESFRDFLEDLETVDELEDTGDGEPGDEGPPDEEGEEEEEE